MRCVKFRSIVTVWVPLFVTSFMLHAVLRKEYGAVSSSKVANDDLWIPSQPDPNCQTNPLAAIRNVVPFETSRFMRCPITSQVRIEQQHPQWILHSLDENGTAKTTGGDEYYITYTDMTHISKDPSSRHVTAVARAVDRSDGTYILDFVASPLLPIDKQQQSGYGQLTIHFEYTCGIGRMGQPMKDAWNLAGYTHTDYTVPNVTMPYIRPFQPPKSDIDLGIYTSVFVLGDSVMNNFVGWDEAWFGKSNIIKGKNPEAALNSATVEAWLAQLRSEFGAKIAKTTGRTAIMVGSSTWDILRNDVDQWMTWDDHKDACRKLITTIQSDFPNVEVLWKSATAIHICNANVEEMAAKDQYWGVERVRYMSESRSHDIHMVQLELMKELNVPVLNVYEATYLSADRSRNPTDSRHYDRKLNELMLNWFYKSD